MRTKMKALKQAIETQGRILNDDVLKVDAFLNHQIDCDLMQQVGETFYEHFKDKNITRVITIESSGIAPSLYAAQKLAVPLVFIKKAQPSTMQNAVSECVFSFTKNKHYTICMDKTFCNENDNVLFIDDFLANGEAFRATESLIHQCGANVAGVGIVIEKAFQKGHQYLIDKGYDFIALASIAGMQNGKIIWNDER